MSTPDNKSWQGLMAQARTTLAMGDYHRHFLSSRPVEV
jgi:hypothetical protein